MRTIDGTTLAAFAAGRFASRGLVRLYLDEGTRGFWDDVYNVTIDSQLYEAAAGAFELTPMPSVSDLSVQAVKLTFSALHTNQLAVIQSDTWHQRECAIDLAAINASTGAVMRIIPVFRGVMDAAHWKEKDGDTGTLEVSIESLNRDLDRKGVRKRADADQRRIDASDGFYKYTGALLNQNIAWGREGPRPLSQVGVKRGTTAGGGGSG